VAGLRAVLPPAPAASAPPAGADASRAAEAAAGAVDRVRVSFPAVASEALVAEGEGVRVVLAPRGTRPARAEVEGGALAYRDVCPQTDALHVVKSEWTEEYLHLRSPGAPRRFEYEIVEAAGATRVFLENGQVRFLEGSGHGLVILAPVSSTRCSWTRPGSANCAGKPAGMACTTTAPPCTQLCDATGTCN
jgi:hypothetical protein